MKVKNVTSAHHLIIMVVTSAACLGFGIMLCGALEDAWRRLDGWLGRLQDGGLTECPPGGREDVKAAPPGIFTGCLRCLPVLEHGAEDFPPGLQVLPVTEDSDEGGAVDSDVGVR